MKRKLKLLTPLKKKLSTMTDKKVKATKKAKKAAAPSAPIDTRAAVPALTGQTNGAVVEAQTVDYTRGDA